MTHRPLVILLDCFLLSLLKMETSHKPPIFCWSSKLSIHFISYNISIKYSAHFLWGQGLFLAAVTEYPRLVFIQNKNLFLTGL